MFTALLAADAEPVLFGLGIILLIAIGILVLAIGVGSIVAGILRTLVFFNYWFPSRTKNSANLTGGDAAKRMLELHGINDVQVKQSGFFSAMFYGNYYNPRKKTIFLRKSTYAKQSLTAVGLAVQKVGLVLQHKRDEKAFYSRWRLQRVGIFGPIFFIPIVIIGLAIDGVMASATGTFSGVFFLVFSIVALSFFILCFVLQGLTIKVEKQANADACKMLATTGLLTPEEQTHVNKVFRLYIAKYIADFILSILEAIKLLFQILYLILKLFSRKK